MIFEADTIVKITNVKGLFKVKETRKDSISGEVLWVTAYGPVEYVEKDERWKSTENGKTRSFTPDRVSPYTPRVIKKRAKRA